jgi:hypothetical protein
MIFDLALAAILVWIGHHRKIRPWGLFALYVAGYSAYRIFEETIRIDSSEHFLHLRLNFYVATILMLIGIAWFIRSQRAPAVTAEPPSPDQGSPGEAGAGEASPGEASPGEASTGGATRGASSGHERG